jgi:hypothetical protein
MPHDKFKELFEKIKAHGEKTDDPELKAIAQEFSSLFDPAADDSGGGSNHPQDPSGKP